MPETEPLMHILLRLGILKRILIITVERGVLGYDMYTFFALGAFHGYLQFETLRWGYNVGFPFPFVNLP